jgi:DNA polymerase III epsilon subunit-like protein
VSSDTAERREKPVTYISVDIEAAGPSPSGYAMLSIGACVVDPETEPGFYVELQPDREGVLEAAMSVGGFTLDGLRASGTAPEAAMQQFADWITSVTPAGHRPVMVGFNAVFDWMFVADYFHRYLGHNPFGHSALDIKAFYLGATGSSWAGTSMNFVAERYGLDITLTHNALDDARDQAALFRAVRAELAARS